MAARQTPPLKPRKKPIQARSTATVDSLFEASLQVLLAVGYRKMTTTRVADRAGVSVGTLYQYFPNRQALMAAVIQRYLDGMSASIERACGTLKGKSLDEIAKGLVDAFIDAKCQRVEVARAMQEPLADVGGAALVRQAAPRVSRCVAGVLSSSRATSFADPQALGEFIVAACISLLQAALAHMPSEAEMAVLRLHMRALVRGYLREMQQPGRAKQR